MGNGLARFTFARKIGASGIIDSTGAASGLISNGNRAPLQVEDESDPLFVAINLLALLVALLRLYREGCDRTGLEPLQRDRLAGLLAIAVGVVLDPLQRGVDLGDQLALAVAGAQLDRAVGLGGSAVGKIRMIDVLLLQGLQGEFRFLEDLVLPGQELGAEIVALALVHERLFFRGSVVLQLFQGQPICTHKRRSLAAAGDRIGTPPRAPYIAAPCDRQYRPSPQQDPHQSLAQAGLSNLSGSPATSITDRKALPWMRRPLDLVNECNCEIGEGNPAFSAFIGQEPVGPEAELAGPLALGERRRGRQEGPVQVFLEAKPVEEGRPLLGFRLVSRREIGGRHQPDTRRNVKGCRRRRPRGSD